MAGYMTKQNGYLYEGELVNGASGAVANGILMVHGDSTDVGKLKLIANADTTSKFLCKEVASIYDGITAYRFVVNKLNANYYFVEQNFEPDPNGEYNIATMTTAVGKQLRAHPLQVGDEFVTNCVTGTPAAGTAYGVKTDGTIG